MPFPLSGMIPAPVADYIDDFLTSLQRAHDEPDRTWEAQERAQNALPLRAQLAQIFSIPPANPPLMMPPAVRRDTRLNTILPQAQEIEFQRWLQHNAPFASGENYDLRGAFKAGVKPDVRGALPPTFQKAGMLPRSDY